MSTTQIAYYATSPIIIQFIHSLNTLPDRAKIPADIEHVVLPALQYEHLLHYELDPRPYAGLLDVFDIPRHCKVSCLRQGNDYEKYIFPSVLEGLPRLGMPSCVETIERFKHNFDLFTHGVLRQFRDWKNVLVAGGAVLAALMYSEYETPNDLVRLYHTAPYEASDIDIFFWGLSPAEAEEKISSIFNAVKSFVPCDVVAVRKANVISIHTQYPHRPIQIILRLYQSPTEVLIGFDVDCCSVCFNGEHVWATPHALTSIITQQLTIDLTRRSPSYELQLAKYTKRGFEIRYPTLQRWNIHPTLYNRDLPQLPHGLARLLVLEKLTLRPNYYKNIRFPGQLAKSLSRGVFPVLKYDGYSEDYNSFYEHSLFRIPYALSWDAHGIKDLIQRTEDWLTHDRFMNERYLHRHAMRAYDNIQQCFGEVCERCPVPRNELERLEQEKDDQKYIRGRIQWIVQNPGRQTISSSFNPINDEEWEKDAYCIYD